MDPITALIMVGGALLSGAVSGGFNLYQGSQNNKQQERLHQEEMAMANRQFDWGQTVDRFNMQMTVKEAAAKMNESQRAQLMDALKTNIALKDRAGNLFSSKG